MYINLKVIKFTAILSSFFFLITFVICLNISYEWFSIKWLSNEFLLALFSGVFASLLVVLFCEIQKYFLNKNQAENSMHSCCVGMICCFISAKTTLSQLVNDKMEVAPNGILDFLCQNVNYSMNTYFNIDYTTCCKKQKLYLAKTEFDKFLIHTVQKTINDCNFYDIAVNNIKLANCKNGMLECNVNTNDPVLTKVLNVLIDEFTLCIQSLADFLEKVDYKGNFQFKERYDVIRQQEYKQRSIEDFIKENSL